MTNSDSASLQSTAAPATSLPAPPLATGTICDVTDVHGVTHAVIYEELLSGHSRQGLLVAFDLTPGLPRILALGPALSSAEDSGQDARGQWWAFESYARLQPVLRGIPALGRPWSEVLILRIDHDPPPAQAPARTPVCFRCGQEYDHDPEGSPGVLVHLKPDGSVDYDRDRDHVPWPEGDE